MKRREFLTLGGSATVRAALQSRWALAAPHLAGGSAPSYRTENKRWQAAYDKALAILAGNVKVMPRFDEPILIEGAQYAGIWQECGPHESLVYSSIRPDVAINSHKTFFALQRSDGQLPANNKLNETGFGQIQMVVPIAATAWELARDLGSTEFLETAYTACGRWDDWLMKYRNTRGTGLVEGFCTYDTGQDNSPRWAGIPPQCPGKDAKRYPANLGLPRLCPDLSATVYGGRKALAAMATALGRTEEASRWIDQAESIRRLILDKLYVPEEGAFFDLDASGEFVRVHSSVISQLCGEHVLDQSTFDWVWSKQLGNPNAFWTKFPLPSIALNQAGYQGDAPKNSWAGPAQALTALRATRWFDHYGRSAELAYLMEQWCEAIQRDMTFRQQINPQTGVFAPQDSPGYSPAALVMFHFTWRLGGVHQEGDELWWHVRPGHPATQGSRYEMKTRDKQRTEMVYTAKAVRLYLNDREVASVEGGSTRVVTSLSGSFKRADSISEKPQVIKLHHAGGHLRLRLAKNERFEADRH